MEPEVTYQGKPVLTVEQLAARRGIKPSSVRAVLARLDEPLRPRTHVGRKALYDPEEFDAAMAARPKRGAPGVARPHVPPAERSAKTARTGMGARLRAKSQKKT